jgi:hypothetical protein
VWFAWGAENDEIEVPKKSAETGGHRGELRWAFNGNLGSKEQSERWEERTPLPKNNKE